MKFIIFIIKRILNMATKKTIETTNDKKDKISIIEIIQDIDARLTHIEDIQMDNRDLIVKLVRQGNTIVEFLKDLQLDENIDEDIGFGASLNLPSLDSNKERIKRTEGLKELIDDILKRQDSLKEFEKELKKHKDKITPGQTGEA
jgi:hypothetical protein